ncbi:MAG: class I SAM-dependent methyltransferase [Proteobacteria bacterium]|nr:class I SAM-dependent methyltransferase [Pseudomonadota bacterium]
MPAPAPPRIFDATRRLMACHRASALQQNPDAARYIMADMVEDVLERLAFLLHQPRKALVIGAGTRVLTEKLAAQGCAVTAFDPASDWDDAQPFPVGGYDFVASLGTLDTANDPIGALIHIRRALAQGGLAIASFPGAGSLPELRRAMLAADGDRPAPRLHPMIDVRAGAQLLQRAGWADPVVDTRALDVRFTDLASLVADLRSQGLGNVLARPGPPLGKAALARATETFGTRVIERFEILTLSGWRPSAGPT